jgi:hypothetical protein
MDVSSMNKKKQAFQLSGDVSDEDIVSKLWMSKPQSVATDQHKIKRVTVKPS